MTATFYPYFCTALVCLVTTPIASATTFELLNLGTDLASPLVLPADGILLTLTGAPAFNSTSTSFGMASPTSLDDDNLIDGVETLFFTFDRDVLLDSIFISNFDEQDSGNLVLKSVTTIPLSNGLLDVGGIRLTAGSSDYRVTSALPLSSTGTRGFSLDRITVRTIPEPSSMTLVFVSLIMAFCLRTFYKPFAFGHSVH